MLKTRVFTALLLLLVLLPILYFNYSLGFAVVTTLFFSAAIWECVRLFGSSNKRALVYSFMAMGLFVATLFKGEGLNIGPLFIFCVAVWIVCFVPSLILGLPSLSSFANRVIGVAYAISVCGCFIAIFALFMHSPLYLLSAMSVVWIADIGAYFSGKAFGKHKLAPLISPGKSWEGAVGGWLSVVLISLGICFSPASGYLRDTLPMRLYLAWGWLGLLAVMTLLVAASVIGDLFESQLKRRIGMKDSSKLLPGHGGVLDRIDALIPVLPLVTLLGFWS